MSIELKTITYVGDPPKRRNPFHVLGGWILLLFAAGIGYLFLEPLVPFLVAQQSEANERNARVAIAALQDSGSFGGRLAAAALERTASPEPSGNEEAATGSTAAGMPGKIDRADVVVGCYQTVGVDLQELVHEDMEKNARSYPQYWQWTTPDPRRVPNLHRFLARYGVALPLTRNRDEFAAGDVVVWRLPFATDHDGARHIGVVVPGPGARNSEKWVVHNEGNGAEWDDDLFRYELIGHYRYVPGAEAVTAVTTAEEE